MPHTYGYTERNFLRKIEIRFIPFNSKVLPFHNYSLYLYSVIEIVFNTPTLREIVIYKEKYS